MTSSFHGKMAVAALGLVLALGAALDAQAVTRTRTFLQLSAGLCDAVNPVQDDLIRRYATGIRNIDTGYVTIACSLLGDDYATGGLGQVFIYFNNSDVASQTVSCTLAAGTPFYGLSFHTKSMVLASGATSFLSWTAADYPAGTQFANLTCRMPTNSVAQEVALRYDEDVGA